VRGVGKVMWLLVLFTLRGFLRVGHWFLQECSSHDIYFCSAPPAFQDMLYRVVPVASFTSASVLNVWPQLMFKHRKCQIKLHGVRCGL
jgi:hypothetical protein